MEVDNSHIRHYLSSFRILQGKKYGWSSKVNYWELQWECYCHRWLRKYDIGHFGLNGKSLCGSPQLTSSWFQTPSATLWRCYEKISNRKKVTAYWVFNTLKEECAFLRKLAGEDKWIQNNIRQKHWVNCDQPITSVSKCSVL